ncbi:MAG: Gfo/Idh/MocA family oxidoreductase [Acidimicrobiia bacterium]|nr:Gfo/Idh/MocA family oxidoreductase [Acidimicrobiia bacterium]
MRQSGAAVRFGVIGCGVIAYWAHLRELPAVRNAVLVAAADPNAEARRRVESLIRIPVYASAEELLGRSDIDAVVISTPTPTHAPLAAAACDARKHFYVEKPLASSREEGRQIMEAARRAGVTGAVGFNRRFHPVYQQARSMLAGGAIGRVRAVVAAICEPVSPALSVEWRRSRSSGGGALLEFGSHLFDLLYWFLGSQPVEVSASLSSSELIQEDTACVRLTMSDGCQVQSLLTFRGGLSDFLEFVGEQGTMRVDRTSAFFSYRIPRRFGYGMRKGFVLPSRDVLKWWLRRLARPSYDASYRRALGAFVDAVRGADSNHVTLADGMRSLETVLAAEESARAGHAVAGSYSC